METNSNSEQSALLGVILAGTISVFIDDGPFNFWSALIGVLLVIILLAYDNKKDLNYLKNLAFGAVLSFCLLMIVAGILYEIFTEYTDLLYVKPEYKCYTAIFWISSTLLITFFRCISLNIKGPNNSK